MQISEADLVGHCIAGLQAIRRMANRGQLSTAEREEAGEIFASILRRQRHLRPVRRAARITARKR